MDQVGLGAGGISEATQIVEPYIPSGPAPVDTRGAGSGAGAPGGVQPVTAPSSLTTTTPASAPIAAPATPASLTVPAPVSTLSSIPTWAWVLGGVAIAGIIGAIIWAATQSSSSGGASKPNPIPQTWKRKKGSRRSQERRRRYR
jgi:hypothetical protein